jgi:hypothetical protein
MAMNVVWMQHLIHFYRTCRTFVGCLAFPFLLLIGFLAFPSVIKAEPLSIIKKKR